MARKLCFFFRTCLILISTLLSLGKGVVLDCYRTTPSRYDGHQQTTINGDACVRWDSFENDFRFARNFPDATVADAANYCRNPDKDNNLWCFTGNKSNTWSICGIKKCAFINVNQCGHLSIKQPTILGRNVTFTFTPDTNNSDAILKWQRTNKRNPWATLPDKYKFTQYFKDGTYYLILTETVRYNDDVYYRVYYDNKRVRCLMETPRLVLRDISSNPCGFLHLRTTRLKEDDNVEIEYYPSKNVMQSPENFVRQWRHFTNRAIPISLKNDLYEETREPNDKYVLTITMLSSRMTGKYKVYCGKRAKYSNAVTVTLPEPPSAPAFDGLQDIEDCKGCIVGEDGDQFRVLCKTNGGTEPVKATMAIGNEALHPLKYDVTPGYMVFFYLRRRHHMAVMSCTVSNDALTTPLNVTAHVYVKQSPLIEFNISGSVLNIIEGEQAYVKCSAKSVPASNISWVEYTDEGNITKKQCHLQTNCVVSIETHLILQRHLYCQAHYLHKIDQRILTVNILVLALNFLRHNIVYNNEQHALDLARALSSGKDEQLSNDQDNSVRADKPFIWTILGSCVAVIVVVIVVFITCIVARRKCREVKSQLQTHQARYRASGDGDRGDLEQETHTYEQLNDATRANGQSEATYSQLTQQTYQGQAKVSEIMPGP